MIHGLTHETIVSLRHHFPGLLVPELISRMAAFRVCFASASYLAEQIGRSPRTVFRYFRLLAEQNILKRVWGSREFDRMPDQATNRWPLRIHGYKLSGFTGWLTGVVSGGIQVRTERHQQKQARDRERKDEKRRARRSQQAQARADFSAQFPELAARAGKPNTERAGTPRAATPTGPRSSVSTPDTQKLDQPEAHETGPP